LTIGFRAEGNAMSSDRKTLLHFSDLSESLRMLYSAALITLGLGYAFAMIQIYETHAGLDGNAGINANDIAIAYSGNINNNRLQTALLGSMSANAPSKDRRLIMDWASDGADKTQYEEVIKPVVENRCMRCHDGSTSGAPLFASYEALAEFAKPDTGMSLATLVRVSHIHLFGMTFIFFIIGSIFSHARVHPGWLKTTVIVLPFLMMITDIGSWYLTKLNTNFAWIIIVSGALMGCSFAFQWCVSMYQIWFIKVLPNGSGRID
jgi:hypothetical protein